MEEIFPDLAIVHIIVEICWILFSPIFTKIKKPRTQKKNLQWWVMSRGTQEMDIISGFPALLQPVLTMEYSFQMIGTRNKGEQIFENPFFLCSLQNCTKNGRLDIRPYGEV